MKSQNHFFLFLLLCTALLISIFLIHFKFNQANLANKNYSAPIYHGNFVTFDCSYIKGGPELTFLGSYFLGDMCRANTKTKCENIDVVVFKNGQLLEGSGQDGNSDCVWLEKNAPLNKCLPKYTCK